jgi:hypothetical protein
MWQMGVSLAAVSILFAWLTSLSGECIANALRREEGTEVPNLLLYNVSKRNMTVDREQKKDLKIVELALDIRQERSCQHIKSDTSLAG